MKAIVTGQVGLDKKAYLQQVIDAAGQDVWLANVGDMMYAEAPGVPAGRILDLPLARLRDLRRAVFKDILARAARHAHTIVNTHATFRWRHGLFYAFDHDLMKAFDADLYVCMVDNIDAIHARMLRDGHLEHSLKDLMVWREEETLATELLSQIVRGQGCFYVQARGQEASTADMLARLLFRPDLRKAYLSFPMSHVMAHPPLMADIEMFRRQMKLHFVCFDPGDLEEKYLTQLALEAVEEGRRWVTVTVEGRRMNIDAAELVSIVGDIDGQIYARDFMLIDQSDLIISYVPRLGDGRAGLSSGVERELQHAHEAAKDVFVIWPSDAIPSPFVTETATAVFPSIAEAVAYFAERGYFPDAEEGGLFR
ncbi:MAG: AAA family ATPase [Planctomycetes bacterium]|nr:AAA family ATPase [Planctomycetota bacterium]